MTVSLSVVKGISLDSLTIGCAPRLFKLTTRRDHFANFKKRFRVIFIIKILVNKIMK